MSENVLEMVGYAMHDDRLARAQPNCLIAEAESKTNAQEWPMTRHPVRAAVAKTLVALATLLAS